MWGQRRLVFAMVLAGFLVFGVSGVASAQPGRGGGMQRGGMMGGAMCHSGGSMMGMGGMNSMSARMGNPQMQSLMYQRQLQWQQQLQAQQQLAQWQQWQQMQAQQQWQQMQAQQQFQNAQRAGGGQQQFLRGAR